MTACCRNFDVCEDRINLCCCLNTGIFLTILLVILLLIVLVLRKRIQIAISMIKEASKYVKTFMLRNDVIIMSRERYKEKILVRQ